MDVLQERILLEAPRHAQTFQLVILMPTTIRRHAVSLGVPLAHILRAELHPAQIYQLDTSMPCRMQHPAVSLNVLLAHSLRQGRRHAQPVQLGVGQQHRRVLAMFVAQEPFRAWDHQDAPLVLQVPFRR